MPEHPEHALSRPAYYNMGHILASCVPRLQFPYWIVRGSVSAPLQGSTGAIVDPSTSKSCKEKGPSLLRLML
jgi:hypothetical protein